MRDIGGSVRRSCRCRWAWTPSISALSILLAGLELLNPLHSWAQAQECGVSMTAPLRVENATGVETLRAAANCTDGGSLEVTWAGAIALDAPISIAPGFFLAITGEDNLAEVQGGSQTRMFEVSPGGRLTLTQLKLTGGTGTIGGAIHSDSANLTLEACGFYSNVATDGDGGAVWAGGGDLTITGGEFVGNNATSGYGGAVSATGSEVTVQQGASFEGNTAIVGGALYCGGAADELGLVGLAPSCSLHDAHFASNSATGVTEGTSFYDFSDGVDGGGAVAFLFSSVNATDSVFTGNHAENSGGAIVGGNSTDITVSGCTFDENTAVANGGAIAAASLVLGGDTRLTNNTASTSGAAVYGWDPSSSITFNDVVCAENVATRNGGCFYSAGTGIVNNGTVMMGNQAQDGGCIYAFDGSEMNVFGGKFTGVATRKGGFLFSGDAANVTITGGFMENNEAFRRGGAIYVGETQGSTLRVEGGTFRDNVGWEAGGAIAARSSESVVDVAGGIFVNNTAVFYGGFAFIFEGASLSCEMATIRDNYAGDQGAAIYGRGSTSINSTCDLIGNESPQGAALYLTSAKAVKLANHTITDNLAFSGSVVYITASKVVATGVTFQTGVDLQEDSSNRAIQSESTSELTFVDCVFDGWLGDTVIYHRNEGPGSLSLDGCDFRESSAGMAVFSLNSDALIRNAIVDDNTFTHSSNLDNSQMLVNHAYDCGSNPDVCGPGECVDGSLGVLCECLEEDESTCFEDGSTVSVTLKTPPEEETFSPNTVSFELVVSAAGDGTSKVIWYLDFENEGLDLDVTPSSGILFPGENITVAVTGTPAGQDVGGNLISHFSLTSVGGAPATGSSPAADDTVEVESAFYLCSAFEYAVPAQNESNAVTCEQCASIKGEEGVDCDSPGATLAALPIRVGYWRSALDAVVVHECFYSDACTGATVVSSADGYCNDGYQGPYCAVCSDGYATGGSNSCHSCDNSKGKLLIAAGALCSLLLFLILLLIIVFLVGGLDAVLIVRETVTRSVHAPKNIWTAPRSGGAVRELLYPERTTNSEQSLSDSTPALDFGWAPPFCATYDDDARQNRNGESSLSMNGHADARQTCKPSPSLSTNRDAYANQGHDAQSSPPLYSFGGSRYTAKLPTSADAWRDRGCAGGNQIARQTSVSTSPSTNTYTDTRLNGKPPLSSSSWLDAAEKRYTRPPRGVIRVDTPAVEMPSVLGRHDRDAKTPADYQGKHTLAPGGSIPADTALVGSLSMRERHGRLPGRVTRVENDAGGSNVPGRHSRDEVMPVDRLPRGITGAGGDVGGGGGTQQTSGREDRSDTDGSGQHKAKLFGLGEIVKRWASRVPLDKFKILVVVWQILTVFSGVAGVEFPSSYAKFLSWLNLVNLDLGEIFAASCVLPRLNFYRRLLVTTLTPFVLAAGLGVTYRTAIRRSAIGSAGVAGRRDAWSRHVAAGLLLTFVVFTSVSTMVFETFDCDDEVGDGETYLRADYTLSCDTNVHRVFQGYAILMILVYPFGIPALYAAILWRNRELLNPRLKVIVVEALPPHADGTEEASGAQFSAFRPASNYGQTGDDAPPAPPQIDLQEFKERVKARKEHPELAPSMFLWRDFDPDWFYFEVIECGRRMLLTGVLVFIAPHSWVQAATACIFAVGILLGFELMRPHLDPTDTLLYRLGCVIIFLSNFLALLIKMDAAGEENRSALGGLLVAVNVILVLSVLFTSWFTTQQSVDDSRDVILR